MENTKISLHGKKVAILATDGFEESEFFSPLEALEDAGAQVEVVSPQEGKIRSWSHHDWSRSAAVDRPLSAANPADYDALVLPGGVINADSLRTDPKAVEFAGGFFEAGKPVAAICHAAWLLIEGGHVKGKRMTSWPSLKSDLANAGADWVDEEVVVDEGLVTSRKPQDLPAFNARLLEEIAEGIHRPDPRLTAQRHLGELPH